MELKRAHDGLDEKPPAAPEQKPSAKAKLAEPKSTAAMMGGMGGEITFNLGGTATWVCGALKFTKQVNPGSGEKTARKAIAAQLNAPVNAPERKELDDGYDAWSAEEKRKVAEKSQQKLQDADEKETMTDYLQRKCKINYFKLVATDTYAVLNAIAWQEAKNADDKNMKKMIGLDTEGPGDIPLYIQLALCTGNEYVVLIFLITDIADLETFNFQFKKFTYENKSKVFVFGAGEYDPDPKKTPSFEMLSCGIPDDAKKATSAPTTSKWRTTTARARTWPTRSPRSLRSKASWPSGTTTSTRRSTSATSASLLIVVAAVTKIILSTNRVWTITRSTRPATRRQHSPLRRAICAPTTSQDFTPIDWR